MKGGGWCIMKWDDDRIDRRTMTGTKIQNNKCISQHKLSYYSRIILIKLKNLFYNRYRLFKIFIRKTSNPNSFFSFSHHLIIS